MSILKRTKDKIAECHICEGSARRSMICECYRLNEFLKYYSKAEIIEDYVVPEYAKKVKDWMKDHNIYCACILNPNQRRKYKHSAAFMGAQCALYTKIYNDEHLIQSIFNRIDIEDGQDALQNYYDPTFLILELGLTKNQDYVDGYISEILEKRLGKNKKTLVLIPSGTALVSKYGSKGLQEYLTEDLKKKGAFKTILKESK